MKKTLNFKRVTTAINYLSFDLFFHNEFKSKLQNQQKLPNFENRDWGNGDSNENGDLPVVNIRLFIYASVKFFGETNLLQRIMVQ